MRPYGRGFTEEVKLNALVRGNAWLEPQHAVQIPRNQKEWDIIKSIADLMSPAVVSGAGLVAMKAAERDVIGVTRTVFLKMLGATALAGGISVAGVNQLSFMTKGGTDEYAAAKSTLAQISSMRSIILLTDAKSTLHGDFKGPAIAVSHSKGDGLEVFVRGDVEVMKKAILLPEYRASLLYAIIKAGSVENLLSYEVQMLGNTSVKVIKDREFVDSLKNISAPLMKEGDDLGGVLV